MVQSQIVEDHDIPVVPSDLLPHPPRHLTVHLGEVEHVERRHTEGVDEVAREEFLPRVVPVEKQSIFRNWPTGGRAYLLPETRAWESQVSASMEEEKKLARRAANEGLTPPVRAWETVFPRRWPYLYPGLGHRRHLHNGSHLHGFPGSHLAPDEFHRRRRGGQEVVLPRVDNHEHDLGGKIRGVETF